MLNKKAKECMKQPREQIEQEQLDNATYLCVSCQSHQVAASGMRCPGCMEARPDCPLRILAFPNSSRLWQCSTTACAWWSKTGACAITLNN